MWSEKISVSSCFEYWMLFTWHCPVVPSAACEFTMVRTLPSGVRCLMSLQPSVPLSAA